MKHVAILALTMVLVALGARVASAKPKVAVLGIEVTGAIDQTSTGVAHDLTEGMRSKAKQGNGPFQLAPSSDRELIDEKVLKNCDSEGPLCMSDIGKDIGTDVLIYGQLAKAGDGYSAKLFVLDVKRKSREKEQTVRIPGGASSDAIRAIAKKAYTDLVGGGDDAPPARPGTLLIEANVDSGTVFVDDEQKASLVGGKAKLELPEGRYRVAVEASGRRRKEVSVTIGVGEATTESFELAVRTESGGKRATYWKPLFGASLGAAIVLAGVSWFELNQAREEILSASEAARTKAGKTLTQDACPDDFTGGDAIDRAHFDEACSAYKVHVITYVGAAVFGAVAIGSAYMAFVHKPSESTTKTSARKALRDRIAITPVLSPETQGAVLGLTF